MRKAPDTSNNDFEPWSNGCADAKATQHNQ